MSDHECKLCCVYESYLVISNFYLFLKMSMNTKQVNDNMTHLKHGLYNTVSLGLTVVVNSGLLAPSDLFHGQQSRDLS